MLFPPRPSKKVRFTSAQVIHGLLLLFFLVLQSCSVNEVTSYESTENFNFPEQGVSWKLAQFRSERIKDLQYSFNLNIPSQQNAPITGKAKITFSITQTLDQPIVLDFLSPTQRVKNLMVNGLEIEWVASHDHIVIPASAFGPGQNTVALDFQAGDEAFNRNPDFLYALFVPDRAHYSLPLFDQPNLKAPVTWEVTAPKEWRVIANGPAIDSRDLGESTHTVFS